MKLLKALLIIVIAGGFSSCEIQGNVIDTVAGTPTKADTVLPHKLNNKSDSLIELRNQQLPQIFHK